MRSCGLVVEYNPLHNGHIYHIEQAKAISQADCMIAVMSGQFLQRGEPAIIDKFHRTRTAIQSGIDIVLELPYAYAVQSSEKFAKGAVLSLHEIGASHICFGSESGNITDFVNNYNSFKDNESLYTEILKKNLKLGFSFPQSSMIARQACDNKLEVDLTKPNNILGMSYVQTILDLKLPIELHTIKRKNNHYHQLEITNSIASATSIRKQLLLDNSFSEDVNHAIPTQSVEQLKVYAQYATTWHRWENYFHLLHYRVLTMSTKELKEIHGIDEGLEHRIKQTAQAATSFKQWVATIKTKRYTWTRLQRVFVHILTNTKKDEIKAFEEINSIPYIRILGLSNIGKRYLRQYKKEISVPIVTQLSRNQHPLLLIDERASHAYYSILPQEHQIHLWKQEIEPPIFN